MRWLQMQIYGEDIFGGTEACGLLDSGIDFLACLTRTVMGLLGLKKVMASEEVVLGSSPSVHIRRTGSLRRGVTANMATRSSDFLYTVLCVMRAQEGFRR
ncbi:hypothetical protein TREES_T100012913 [Tupaia chinensis]|uniref:Uncharacterized protein n=1 Tax=Tupaia chinensis TaxID=246437 RepID=L9L4H9_TUPCH|nr:hypothetical protein TREES_T100012913 [Tupaia chinensis]